MARRKKIIAIPKGSIEKLMAATGCSRSAVWNALAYRCESETAEMIRRTALESFGGVETTKLVLR